MYTHILRAELGGQVIPLLTNSHTPKGAENAVSKFSGRHDRGFKMWQYSSRWCTTNKYYFPKARGGEGELNYLAPGSFCYHIPLQACVNTIRVLRSRMPANARLTKTRETEETVLSFCKARRATIPRPHLPLL